MMGRRFHATATAVVMAVAAIFAATATVQTVVLGVGAAAAAAADTLVNVDPVNALDVRASGRRARATSSVQAPAAVVPAPRPKAAPVPTRAAPVSAAAAASKGFTIQMQLLDIPSSDRSFFNKAKARWEQVIAGDLTDVSTIDPVFPDRPLLPSRCIIPRTIDDLYICARYEDWGEGIVGLGGFQYVRNKGDKTPVLGNITMNSFYRTTFNMTKLILHEMGHVLGFGTNWPTFLDKTEAGKCWYVGANGVKQYKTVSGCDRIPLAPIGKSCPHYDSKCLPTELLNKGGRTSTQITRVTLGVLADLGYTVNYTRADALRAADLGAGCTCAKNGNGRRDLERNGRDHPETAPQLLLPPLHRKLSAAGHQRAVEFGRSVLAERAASMSAHDRRRLIDASDVVYVGDQVVSILIAEGDEVYSVVVHAK